MKEDFLKYQAQTSSHPLGMEIGHASGSYIFDTSGKAHLDFVAGVSACTLGHCHKEVVRSVKEQLDRHMHVMVYGEYIQGPAVEYAKLLAEQLPKPLETTYLVNSGTEAVEGAIKLARCATGRSEIIAMKNAYHGNTMGSLSLMDYEERKAPFRPLLPDIRFINFNDPEGIPTVTKDTAAVILETIQGGAGFIMPDAHYLQELRKQCDDTGALLILDEIQPGFGRTGTLFAFQQLGIVPDILVMGKGMASGLPVGAFTSSPELMSYLGNSPELGHITTFGGNPVIASAALTTLKTLINTELIEETLEKEILFRQLLQHDLIMEIRGRGLMLALVMESQEIADELIGKAAEKGLILFWLLFEPKAVRVTPPLTISIEEIKKGCRIILEILTGITQ